MNKVLIVGTIWPYQHGGVRVPGLARYLPEFGWEPVVLTRPLLASPELGYRIVEVGYSDLLQFAMRRWASGQGESTQSQLARKAGLSGRDPVSRFIFHAARDVITYPDIYRGWRRPAVKKGSELIKSENIRAVISASPPVGVNLVAAGLKKRCGIPWVADFPHLWSLNNSYPYSELRRWFDRRLERKALSFVDVMTTTSDSLAVKIHQLHPAKRVEIITHGYDPETENIPPEKLTAKFSITYTGGFALVRREPEVLLAAVRRLLDDGVADPERVEVRFYGAPEVWVEEQIGRYGLENIARQYGKVSMPEAQARQRESHLLYNPKWNDPDEPGIHSMKIMEYLAARRPILATGLYRDVVDDLLEETGAGACTYDVDGTLRVLADAYRTYLVDGNVPWRGNPENTARYSHRGMAGRFAGLLDGLVR